MFPMGCGMAGLSSVAMKLLVSSPEKDLSFWDIFLVPCSSSIPPSCDAAVSWSIYGDIC